MGGYPGYFICDDDAEAYPRWYPSDFFNITDPRLSRYWIASIKEDDRTKNRLFLSFFEWANEEYFYNNLIEGEEREIDIFNKYKQLMDLEFPNPSITKIAQIGDKDWLICPSCIDTWNDSDVRNALVACPNCHKIFCNPAIKIGCQKINTEHDR